jgi:hypothetical protein
MSIPVVSGAMLTCPMGLAPSTLTVIPKSMVMAESMPLATVMDNIPMANVAPFGLCTSLTNPITAAQTAAALGVLTPGTCIPVFPAPWAPGSPTVMVGGVPALTMTSKCACAYGGVVSIVNPGATRETVP